LFFVKKSQVKRSKRIFVCLDVIFRHHKDKDTTKGVIAFSQKNMVKENRFFRCCKSQTSTFEGCNLYKRTTAKELAQIYTQGMGEDPKPSWTNSSGEKFIH
jgi:hypothetical protein